MNKNKKFLNLLAGLRGEVTVRDIREVRQKGGVTLIEIPVDHKIHSRPCDDCGSTYTKKHGLLVFNACHIPQGKRQPCKIICKKQRFLCKSCGNTFVEDVPWLYKDAHITVPLAECITRDLHSIMTKNDIARVNCVSTHYVDIILKDLVPPIPDHLPEVLCLDETFSQVEDELDEKTQWIKFVTNLSDGQTGELLDIIPYRTKRKLVKYFNGNFSHEERCRVRHLCCDGAKFYMELAGACFPNADVCLDNFHVTKYLHTGLYSVRTKQQNYLLSKSDALNDKYHKEYVDLKHLSHKFITSLFNQQSYWGDNYGTYVKRIRHHLSICPELKDAYAMLQYYYEIFHDTYDYEKKTADLDKWISIFGKSTSEAIASAVKTVRNHLPYIRNAWKHGFSNAVCEGNNNVIQTLKDVSFGIHNFEYFRTRTLLIVGQPGVARAYKKLLDAGINYGSFFYDDFPSLDDYVLAYDWTSPLKDFSKEG